MKTKPALKLRQGTHQHDIGLAFILLVHLADDLSTSGKRRRSELAQHISNDDLTHKDLEPAL